MNKLATLAAACLCLCLASCASWTPEDHARIAAALQQTGNNISAQQAANTASMERANARTMDFLQARQQAYSPQAGVEAFQQQAYQNDVRRSLNNIDNGLNNRIR